MRQTQMLRWKPEFNKGRGAREEVDCERFFPPLGPPANQTGGLLRALSRAGAC